LAETLCLHDLDAHSAGAICQAMIQSDRNARDVRGRPGAEAESHMVDHHLAET
jgi:hypothetical protein